MTPESTGEATQLAAMIVTFAQFTAENPTATMEKPMIAPTIECVVETGQPLWDAISSQVAVANKAASIP